jgi:undecaprenyl phosphate N,N'-diacetylbacillosamine 1-phosphate transferase
MYSIAIKPFFDFIISLILLVLLIPIFIFLSILIKLTSKGPVFFIQLRLGKNRKLFYIYKFRTMVDKNRDVNHEIFKGDNDVTNVGFYLRRLKIDELPQLINILKGDMSFVGPRPCMPFQIEDFNEDGKFRLNVTPGLTGLAQVNGNIYLSWEQRWKYDKYYVDNQTFFMDLKIVLKTIFIIIFGEIKFINKPNV